VTVTVDRPQAETLPRLLAADAGLAPMPAFAGADGRGRLIDLVDRAGLRGRGGAGFPTGRKLRAVAAGAKEPVVLVNGCESEPASRKDKVLLAYAPRLVLDGAALAAHAVGATRVVVCVERGTGLAGRLAREIAQRPGGRVRWQVKQVPRRYVASEETSLVHFVNAGEAKPLAVPPRPFERGVDGRPTLVDNVETLAHLALIASHGADWFRAVGTPTDPGSTLVTVGGAVDRPGVYEISPGTTLGSVLDAAGGAAEPLRAALVGGYFGTWVPLPDGWHLPLSHDRCGPAGTTLGAGAIVALPASSCGLAETARVVRYLAEESARQCGPCMFGLPAIAGDLAAVAAGRADPAAYPRLSGRLAVVAGRGACRHPDGATRLAASALDAFGDDLRAHLAGRPCSGPGRPPVLPLPQHRDRGWR
jgi:NADH:ubiquinone oxidoreductase subunit F (NADH-binding)